MAGTFPKFKLYQSDGVTLVYEFDAVTNYQPDPFQDPQTFTLHESLRGQGGIVSEGSNEPWDFTLDFRLSGNGYEVLIALISTVPNTILFNTKYILKIDLTAGGSTKDLKVKRLQPLNFPIEGNQKVTFSQRGIITFKVDVWV